MQREIYTHQDFGFVYGVDLGISGLWLGEGWSLPMRKTSAWSTANAGLKFLSCPGPIDQVTAGEGKKSSLMETHFPRTSSLLLC